MPMETKWAEIVTRRHKGNNSDRGDNIYRIPVIKNRYKLPCDIEVNETQILNSTGNQESKKPYKTLASLRKKRHRIVIIGDSHGRECASKISHNLYSDFEVQGIIKPNADLIMAITNTVKEEIKLLTKNDVVVIWGGTRDVGRNETSDGLKQLKDFYRKNYQMNIIQMSVPHRFDLPVDSCVNKEVEVFNRKLGKLVKAHDHTALITVNINRELNTKHGLHLNDKGKELAVRKIIPIIKNILYKKN
jgi:hypothetical protein